MEKKVGRPRSEETRKLILSTAYQMLLEIGFKAVTVDGIAIRTGVSKATIYKWWPNKAAVVVDGFFEASELLLKIPDTGSAKEDLFIQVNNLAAFFTGSKGKIVTELIAEGQFDTNIASEYQKRYFQPRRLITRQILERGIQRNQVKKDIDVELVIDIIYAPIFYRLMITGDKIDKEYIDKMLEQTTKEVFL
ncbi:MAG: TetR/AcrR family transcriptional regulator [Mobilitalea sp.]